MTTIESARVSAVAALLLLVTGPLASQDATGMVHYGWILLGPRPALYVGLSTLTAKECTSMRARWITAPTAALAVALAGCASGAGAGAAPDAPARQAYPRRP